ncbi:MAG: BrnT family toxin [Isosphaeraceae bacterium]
MDFEWDDAKAEANERKHGVAFSEAMTVFADPISITAFDPLHSDREDRFLTMGTSIDGVLLVVSHVERGEVIRIISAREATRREREDYEDGSFP